jgi:hypothetical protein
VKSTNEVIEAVRDGGECTEEELRYAVRNLSIWQNSAIFPIARAATESPVSERTKRDMNSLYESAQAGNKVPLDVRLKGGSFEPGISKDERTDRFVSHTTDTAMKLVQALSPPTNQEHGEG